MTRQAAINEAQRRANALGRPFNVFTNGRNYLDYIVISTARAWPKGWIFVCVKAPAPNWSRVTMHKELATFDVEYTDTFGGDANYSWVRRYTIEAPRDISDRALMRRAKSLCGLTGMRGRTYWHGDMGEFRPYRCCTVLFINHRDE